MVSLSATAIKVQKSGYVGLNSDGILGAFCLLVVSIE